MLPEAKYRFLSEDVKRRSGLVLGPEKGYLVESRLAPLARTEGLPLETTYTGKAMAALLDYTTAHPGARLLFVDTYAESPAIEEGDWRQLPRPFWPIFDPSVKVRCWCWRGRRDPDFCWK